MQTQLAWSKGPTGLETPNVAATRLCRVALSRGQASLPSLRATCSLLFPHQTFSCWEVLVWQGSTAEWMWVLKSSKKTILTRGKPQSRTELRELLKNTWVLQPSHTHTGDTLQCWQERDSSLGHPEETAQTLYVRKRPLLRRGSCN